MWNGADINAVHDTGTTPLHVSVQRGNYEMSKILIQNGANVEIKDKGPQRTPLIMAAWKIFHEIARLLVENGAYVNTKESHGLTPLLLISKE